MDPDPAFIIHIFSYIADIIFFNLFTISSSTVFSFFMPKIRDRKLLPRHKLVSAFFLGFESSGF